MKKIVFVLCTLLFASLLFSCQANKPADDLFIITDYYVNIFHDPYACYGIFDYVPEYARDSDYAVYPIGRWICIDRLDGDTRVYEGLEYQLRQRYENDTVVRRIYVSDRGSLVINCRYQ